MELADAISFCAGLDPRAVVAKVAICIEIDEMFKFKMMMNFALKMVGLM